MLKLKDLIIEGCMIINGKRFRVDAREENLEREVAQLTIDLKKQDNKTQNEQE